MRRACLVMLAALTSALGAVPAVAPAAKQPKERQVNARTSAGALPRVAPVGRLRATERVARLRVRTAPDATVEARFQIFCFDKQIRLKRVQRTFRGTGTLTATLRRPRGRGLGCSTDASVRVSSRPAPASGSLKPVRVSAALYAR